MSLSDPEFRVCWQQRPHMHYHKQVMFVCAKDKEAAEAAAREGIERRWGIDAIGGITVWSVELHTRPEGRVLG